jgi:hypothetical protein
MTIQLPTDGRTITYQTGYRRCGVCKACRAGGKGHGPYRYAFWRDAVTKKLQSKYMGKAVPGQGAS